MKKAFITGITGQDGSYLAEFLLDKGYQVIGLVSKEYSIGDSNIVHLKDKLRLEYGDLLDKNSLKRIIEKYQPSEIYNLGAISFIPASWEKPSLVFNINALGVARLLELIYKYSPQSRFFQATSAKIFGNPPTGGPQNEQTPVKPNTPYAVAKAAAHFLTQNFRDHFNLFACSAIMYNHESERRGLDFVTRKITLGAAKIKLGLIDKLKLGNLKAQQDWGYAPDYVRAMWLMLQQEKADDFIIATGKLHSVEDVCQIAFSHLGLKWQDYVEQKRSLMRKEKEGNFYGDASKAKKKLGWQPETSFKTMIKKMADYDLKELEKLKRRGKQ